MSIILHLIPNASKISLILHLHWNPSKISNRILVQKTQIELFNLKEIIAIMIQVK